MGDDADFFDELAGQLKGRDNPVDLKCSIIGKVEQLSPLIVSYSEGKIQLHEGEELFISEWFRLRCEIDKTGALSAFVPSDLDSATGVTETHSQSGSPCQMPDAIAFLASAINAINVELLQLKCELKEGDDVLIASLEQTDKYLLIDKVLGDVSDGN